MGFIDFLSPPFSLFIVENLVISIIFLLILFDKNNSIDSESLLYFINIKRYILKTINSKNDFFINRSQLNVADINVIILIKQTHSYIA